MNTEKTITINGQHVTMRYCAAAETGFESMSGKSSAIFIPVVERDADGNITNVAPPEATISDYIMLALSAIVAYYARQEEDAPIDGDYLMYDATPEEIKLLTASVVELRNEWYKVPSVIKQEKPNDEEKKKNQDNPKNG